MYIVNQNILKKIKLNIFNIFFNFYFNDLLAPILLLAFSNTLLNYQKKQIKGKQVYYFTFAWAIGWEFITPIFIKNSVCDVWDIVMYLCGANLYLWIKRIIERRGDYGRYKKSNNRFCSSN